MLANVFGNLNPNTTEIMKWVKERIRKEIQTAKMLLKYVEM